MKVKVLSFLQNQWFHDPEKARAMFSRHPEKRNELIKRILFSGCLTGKRLRATFRNLCDEIVWEESSMEIAAYSEGLFVADIEHIRKAIKTHSPNIIICFGKNAWIGVRKAQLIDKLNEIEIIFSPHPAARVQNIMERLKEVADAVEERLTK